MTSLGTVTLLVTQRMVMDGGKRVTRMYETIRNWHLNRSVRTVEYIRCITCSMISGYVNRIDWHGWIRVEEQASRLTQAGWRHGCKRC